jgi:TolB protein
VVGWVTIAGLVGLSPGPAQAVRVGPPPPRGAVVFATARDGHSQIYLINDDGTGLRRLSSGGYGDTHPVFSPDGRRIAFSKTDRAADIIHWVRSIWVMKADGSDARRLTDGTQTDIEPVWSPDGRQLAFTRVADGNARIWLMDADGTHQRPLRTSHPKAVDYRPGYSPDGRHIVFTSVSYDRTGENADIWLIDVDGQHPRRLTSVADYDSDAVFAPNGRQIAFATGRAGNGDIWTMDIDGRDQRQLTTDPAIDTAPAYSPDGSRIVFASNRRGGGGDLWVMNTDGTGQTCLTTDAAADTDPSWSGAPASFGQGRPVTANRLATLPPPVGCLEPDPAATLQQFTPTGPEG